MKKFLVLIKKELKELLTPQILAPLLITVFVFVFIGKVAGSSIEKAKNETNIVVSDMDQTPASKMIIEALSKSNFKVNSLASSEEDKIVSFSKERNISVAVLIPKGFEEGLSKSEPQIVKTYSILKNFSFSGSKDSAMLESVMSSLNEASSDQILLQKLAQDDPIKLKNPILREDKVIIGEKSALTNPSLVMGFVSSQTSLVPVVLFMVIMFAATMIATAVATEKENKTLETLLTAPVNRKYIVSAKMIAAGVVALIAASFYLFGIRYMNSMIGASGDLKDEVLKQAVQKLGLTFDLTGYLILGATLFLAILCAIAIATVLAAFADDVKSVNGLISPLMVLIMIPYFLTMFIDLNTASPALKALIYAIPFSYPFIAAPNIFLHNYSIIFYGMIYQLIFFIAAIIVASKIFSTDRIITMKLSFKKIRK